MRIGKQLNDAAALFKVAFLVMGLMMSHTATQAAEDSITIPEWLVIGPLTVQREENETVEHFRARLAEVEFIASQGGVANLRLQADQPARVTVEGEYLPQAIPANRSGNVILDGRLAPIDEQVAYAYTAIESPKDQSVYALFGSDDIAAVWINGKQVHKTSLIGRGLRVGDDEFEVRLKAGTNHIVVRVQNYAGGWGMGLLLLSEADRAAHLEQQRQIELEREFQAVRVEPIGELANYVFPAGAWIPIGWSQPYMVRAIHGELPLDIRIFDRDLNPVRGPMKPGRHGVIATAKTKAGFVIRRSLTLFCTQRSFQPWIRDMQAGAPFESTLGFDPQVWAWYSESGSAFGRYLTETIPSSETGARLLAALDDWSRDESPPTDQPMHQLYEPDVLDMDYHLRLKRKVLELGPAKGLAAPRKISGEPAPVVRAGTPAEAGVSADLSGQIKAICDEWVEVSGAPFVLCVARHGVIVHHGAYGTWGGQPVTTDSRLGLASVTKALTGMMFAQFLEQGLVKLDEPIGKHLPDIPTTGEKAITWRQCFTHSTGFTGHRFFGGMLNPWLDNVLMSAPSAVRPGQHFEYNGMGYDLAGLGMAMISGKSYFRLVHEHLYGPLGIESVYQTDLGTGTHIRAIDLAKLAQMLLSGGRYGELEFFTPETRELLLPVDITQYYPDLENAPESWGIGLTWMPWPSHFDQNLPAEASRTIGHGSAWSSIFRVDLERDIIVTMVRRETGDRFNEYQDRLLRAIEAGLVEAND
jgi:CubicO group peptidase (beta-lactamase class C family)